MDEAKRVDVRCMCLSFAVNTVGPGNPDAVVEVAQSYYRFVMAEKAKLRLVGNDNPPQGAA